MDQHIINLISILKSDSTEKINDATQQLDEILLKPENFHFYPEILKTNDNTYVQNFILLSLGRFIIKNRIEEDFILPLIEVLVNIIQNDSNFRTCCHSCKAISRICIYQSFFEIDDIINLFLQNKKFVHFGFLILEDCYLSLSDPDSISQQLLNLFKEQVVSSDKNVQEISVSFFIRFIFDISDESILILDDPSLFGLICTSLVTSIQKNTISSVENYVDILYNFLNKRFEFIKKYSNVFFELAFSCISDESVPIDIRAAVHRIFEQVDFIPDELLTQIIPLSIQMSCELCSEENLDNKYDYKFNSDFFIKALDHDIFRNNSESFENFISLIQNLSNSEDLNFLQVSIYLLDLVVSCYSQYIGQIKEFIIQTIQFGFNQSNENIVYITFELINDVMDEKSYILKPIYNHIITFFLEHESNKNVTAFSNFCLFLYYLPEQPSNIGDIIEFSTKSYQDHEPNIRYSSIECLKNAICFYRPQEENEFSLIHLDLMMQDQENITIVLELIKELIKVFPNAIKSIIQDIFNLIEQSLQNNNYEIDSVISSLLWQLIEYYPNTMNDFTEQIQAVISFIYEFIYINSSYDENSDNKNDKDYYEQARGNHLLLVTSSYKYYDANEEMMMKIFEELLNNEQNLNADKAIINIADKIDSNSFLSKFNYLGSSAISEIILAKGTGDSSAKISEHILSEFMSEDDFPDSVFILISAFVNDKQKVSEPILEVIQKIAEDKDFVHQGWAILSLVYITHFNEDKESISELLQSILKIIDIDDLDQKLLLFISINAILMNYGNEIQLPTEIQNVAQEFFDDQFSNNRMKNECILTLLLSNQQIDLGKAKSLLSSLSIEDMPSNSFLLLQSVKAFATIITHLFSENSETFSDAMASITLFAVTLEPYIWIKIDEDVRNIMKQFLSGLSEEWILNYLRQNEQKMNLLKKNVNI